MTFQHYPVAQNELSPEIYTGFDNRKAESNLRGVSFRGKTIGLRGNKWVVADLVDGIVDGESVDYEDSYYGDGYEITKDTYIEFEYKCDKEGEIHGLTFEKVKNPKRKETERNRIRLNGTQRESRFGEVMDYRYTESDMGKWKHFKIKIGDIYETGNYRLVLINDHDVKRPTAKSAFRNIKVYSEKSVEDKSKSVTLVEEFAFFDKKIPYEAAHQIAEYKTGFLLAVTHSLLKLPEDYSEFENWEMEWPICLILTMAGLAGERDGVDRLSSFLDENNDKSELFYQYLLELRKKADDLRDELHP